MFVLVAEVNVLKSKPEGESILGIAATVKRRCRDRMEKRL
jgi:hypothetical protein